MTISPPECAVAPAPSVAGPTMSAAEWGMLLALSVLWGGAFFAAKIALAEVSPLVVVASRVSLAAVMVWALIAWKGIALPREPRLWRDYFVLGLIGNVIPFGLIAWGQVALPGGLAAILNASTPLWVVLLAHVTTADERATGQRLAGVAIGILGVAVIVGPQAFSGGLDALLPSLAIVGAAMSYACAAIFGRRFKARPPALTAGGQLLMSSLVAVPALLLIEGVPAMPSATAIAALGSIGFLSTGLAFLLYFRILAGAGSTNAALVTFLVPVSAILLGALFLGEALEPREFLGMAAIALGLAAIDGRPVRALRRRLVGGGA